jgi:serine/threonine protein kinase
MEGRFEFPSPYWDDVSDSAKDLIRHLLVVSQDKRYTAQEALNHPWIAGNAASSKQIPGVLSKIKEFNAHRKLKVGMLAALAAHKWISLSQQPK